MRRCATLNGPTSGSNLLKLLKTPVDRRGRSDSKAARTTFGIQFRPRNVRRHLLFADRAVALAENCRKPLCIATFADAGRDKRRSANQSAKSLPFEWLDLGLPAGAEKVREEIAVLSRLQARLLQDPLRQESAPSSRRKRPRRLASPFDRWWRKYCPSTSGAGQVGSCFSQTRGRSLRGAKTGTE